jgi:hypothetical protein
LLPPSAFLIGASLSARHLPAGKETRMATTINPAANSHIDVTPNTDVAYTSPDLTVLIKGAASGLTYDSATNPQKFTWTLLYDKATPVGGSVTPLPGGNGFTISAGTATFSLSDAENPNVPLGFLALDTAGPPVTIMETPSPNGQATNGLTVSFTDPQAPVGTVAVGDFSSSAIAQMIGHIG